jgi:antirestriction protein ArdC
MKYSGHALGTYRNNAKALTKITNSLRCNFGIGIHPWVNPWLSVFTEYIGKIIFIDFYIG